MQTLQRIDPRLGDAPLFDVAATRRIEAAALAALPPHTLMQRAGEAVARLALALAPHARTVRIHAGGGNNGGDGFEAAQRLRAAGKQVEVLTTTTPKAADAIAALARARSASVAIDPAPFAALNPDDLVIDALLGIGASRAPDGAVADAIRQINAAPCTVLAVDLPSGLNADTGQPYGAEVVRATHTIALLTLKPGLFTAAGRDLAGTVWLAPLEVTPGESGQARLGAARPLSGRRHAQHKGSFGDVVVIGGAPGMGGAALLAARSAQAGGAGRVYVELLDDDAPRVDAARPELMLRPHWSRRCGSAELAAATLVCGCGGGDAVAAVLPRVLGGASRLVLDADALNVLATDAQLAAQLDARHRRGAVTVLTPHPLEAARLLGCSTGEVQADRLRAARALAERHRCVVLLKGSGSVIAAPGDVTIVNPTGSAALASAGTGDVLAGWLAAHWSQRDDSDPLARAIAAAAHSAWLHGHAADDCGAPVLTASRLIERMAAAELR